MHIRVFTTLALLIAATLSVSADVRTEQKTQVQFGGTLGRVVNMFGGKAAREGITTTVIVRGDRKVLATDTTSQIIDLAEEKVYDVDLRRKSYKVTTFAELRRRLEEAQRRAAEEAKREQPRGDARESKGDQKEIEVDFDVKNTGQTKAVNGFNTSQAIMTVTVREKGKALEQSGGLVLTSDVWLAPDRPEMKEVAEFDRRYAEKVYGGLVGVSPDQIATVMAMYPQLKEGLGRMSAEASKIQGTPIMTTLTFDAVPSAEQQQAQAKEEPSSGRGIGGMLGGLARRARRNNDEADKEQKSRATIMTSTIEVLKVSTAVSAADVAIPAGFKESQ